MYDGGGRGGAECCCGVYGAGVLAAGTAAAATAVYVVRGVEGESWEREEGR